MQDLTKQHLDFEAARTLAHRGKLEQALRLLKREAFPQDAIDTFVVTSMKDAIVQKQFAMLLSFLFEKPEFQAVCPMSVQALLKELYDLNDYAGFLKQTFRFQLTEVYESQVAEAIVQLLESGQIESANAYKLRLRKLTAPESSTNHSLSIMESCDLCDKALSVLRRLNTNVTRHQERHNCEFRIAKTLSATVYHSGATLRVYIHSAPEYLELLLEMAEYGQIRTINRRDPENLKESKRPLVAVIHSKDDVELVMPLVAFSHSFKSTHATSIEDTVVQSPLQTPPRKTTRVAMLEGRRTERKLESPERNPRARAACLASHGLTCKVCDMNFQVFYGALGNGFIHVHHLDPLYRATAQREVDPITDLVPVCANCHAMLHRRIPPYSIDELKRIVRIAKGAGPQ
jgi:hypothetical protein